MRDLNGFLSDYAAYHRDRRNIATHFVGIPMIVVATVILLSRPLPLAIAVVLGALAFYARLDRRYAGVMALLLSGCLALAASLDALSTGVWLGVGLGLFVVGWAIQFVGHVFEGRKPAFVDDLVGLLIGPLFVVAEAGFALGLRREVNEEIERRVGPTRSATPPVSQAQ